MELDLGPEIAEFRAELRDWIAAEAPAPLAGLADWNMPLTAGGRRAAKLAEAEAHPAYAEWEAKLADERLICPLWPEEFGGQGMDAVRGAVLNEEFYRAGVPRVTRGMGEWLVGPSVMVHGTPEQRAYFLPRIISGEDVYCQGFSEPGHGSDLAGVQTRGVVEGDELVITGQKVWTSGAGRANRMFLLCRTDPDAPKHAGLSYVLIDFTGPGVQYRPIKQMSGAAGPPAGPGGVGSQAVLERVPQAAGRDRDEHRGRGRAAQARGRRLPGQRLAERVPEQPGRHDLLGDQRDPAEHHRRARPRPA